VDSITLVGSKNPDPIIQISWLDNAGHRGASQVTVS
jgi:hypothetical protein